MIRFRSFHRNNINNHGDNHESVIEMLNGFLESFEEDDLIYLDHKTYFLENDTVVIELKYKEQPKRKVMFEKTVL